MAARIAQLVEQLICNHQVGGSNPFAGSKIFDSLIPVFRNRTKLKLSEIAIRVKYLREEITDF